MRWPCSALNGGVALQEKVPVALLSHTAVDHRAGLAVAAAVHVLGVTGVEACVMALAYDDDG